MLPQRLGIRRNGLCTAVSLLLILGACHEQGVAPVTSESATLRDGERVAQSIALAMKNADIRDMMLRAFRASPYVAHRLVLQDFIGTTDGRRLVSSAAAAIGTTEANLGTAITALPRLDVYVARREDRLSWRGTDNIAVAMTLAGQSPQHAFTPVGPVDYADLRISGHVVIRLQPAGHGILRTEPQSPGGGVVIQDPNDGESGAQYVRRRPDGSEAIFDLRRKREGGLAIVPRGSSLGGGAAVCLDDQYLIIPDPECNSLGWSYPSLGSGIGGWTYITVILSDGDGWGGAEFEFHASEVRSDGALLGDNVVRIETGYYGGWSGSVPLIHAVANGDGRRIAVTPTELDWIWNDKYDPRSLTQLSDYGHGLLFQSDNGHKSPISVQFDH